jgi:hypothetical protein
VHVLEHLKTDGNGNVNQHVVHNVEFKLTSVLVILQDKAQGTEEEKEKAAKQFADINHGT